MSRNRQISELVVFSIKTTFRFAVRNHCTHCDSLCPVNWQQITESLHFDTNTANPLFSFAASGYILPRHSALHLQESRTHRRCGTMTLRPDISTKTLRPRTYFQNFVQSKLLVAIIVTHSQLFYRCYP